MNPISNDPSAAHSAIAAVCLDNECRNVQLTLTVPVGTAVVVLAVVIVWSIVADARIARHVPQ